MTRQLSLGLAVFGATLIGCAASQAANTTLLYDNYATTDVTQNRFKIGSGIEIGDEVVLALNRVAPADRKVGSFSFEYYGLNFSGSEQARVRFYSMTGSHQPSSVIWDSGLVALPGTDASRVTFTDFVTGAVVPLTGFIPQNVLWSVEFSGVGGLGKTSEAGLDVYGPPVVGSGLDTYWQKFSGVWKECQKVGSDSTPMSIDFGSQFAAVPEPSTIALGVLGLLGLAGAALRRRMSR